MSVDSKICAGHGGPTPRHTRVIHSTTYKQSFLLRPRPWRTGRNQLGQLRGFLQSSKRLAGFSNLSQIQKVDPGVFVKRSLGEDVRDHLFSRATSHLYTRVFLDALKKPVKIDSVSPTAML